MVDFSFFLVGGGCSGGGSSEECYFRLREGELYALSGDARNASLHGVLAEDGSEARESLNLRFGLHSARPEDEFSAWREVESAWPEDTTLPRNL